MAKSKLTLKQGEAKRVTCSVTQDGEAVNLTGATLFLGVEKYRTDADYALSKNDAAFNKTQAAGGIVSVFLDSADLDLEPWSYVGELKIAFADPDGTIDKSADLLLEVKPAVIA